MFAQDARLAVGFAGFAGYSKAGYFNTRVWLLTALNQCALPDYSSESILQRFTERATRDFNNLPSLKNINPTLKRVSFMFTGYRHTYDPPLAVLAVISNHINLDKNTDSAVALNEFKCYFRHEPVPREETFYLVSEIGMPFKIAPNDAIRLKKLVLDGRPANSIVLQLVDVFHKFAEHKASEKSVGKQLSSIIIPREWNQDVRTGYHSARVKRESYLPSLVYVRPDIHLNVDNISINPVDTQTRPLTLPRIPRKRK